MQCLEALGLFDRGANSHPPSRRLTTSPTRAPPPCTASSTSSSPASRWVRGQTGPSSPASSRGGDTIQWKNTGTLSNGRIQRHSPMEEYRDTLQLKNTGTLSNGRIQGHYQMEEYRDTIQWKNTEPLSSGTSQRLQVLVEKTPASSVSPSPCQRWAEEWGQTVVPATRSSLPGVQVGGGVCAIGPTGSRPGPPCTELPEMLS